MWASRQDLDHQHATLVTGWALPERRSDEFLITLTKILSAFEGRRFRVLLTRLDHWVAFIRALAGNQVRPNWKLARPMDRRLCRDRDAQRRQSHHASGRRRSGRPASASPQNWQGGRGAIDPNTGFSKPDLLALGQPTVVLVNGP
jgi:hypothetical protein